MTGIWDTVLPQPAKVAATSTSRTRALIPASDLDPPTEHPTDCNSIRLEPFLTRCIDQLSERATEFINAFVGVLRYRLNMTEQWTCCVAIPNFVDTMS
jgi:hypothetical protein